MPFDEPGPASPMKGDKVTHVGSYKLMQVLGKGSFCKVRLASHIVSGQQFAVKIIKPGKSLKWSDVEREITVLRRLDHPNIIRIHQVFYADENNIIHSYVHHGPRHWPPRKMYIIMELAEGGELFDHIISQNFLNEEEARRLFRQILGGLEYTHAHLVIHRDLKPENIVLDSDKNIKINDFGLSCTITPGTRLKNFCGSPVYAAPEIIKKKNYDGAIADIWSLGVMLFTMVTGHLPWKPSNSSPENYFKDNMLQGRFTIPHRIKVSPECVDILRKMMHPEAKKRATIKELRNHPWTNEGFADRPHAFHHNYPPVPLDNTIVKQMVQMGYTSKEVQAIVRNNHTSPILTTYHAIRNLSVEIVPPFSLLNQDQSSGLPSLSLSSDDHSTSSPISISAGSHHAPSDYSAERGEKTSNGDTISSTPPLLRLAIDLPSDEINDNPGDNNEDIQFNDNSNLDSPSVLTHLTPFADYRSKLGESDYYVYSSSFSPSSPSIPTSHSFPYPHHSPQSSPNISHSQSTLSYSRPRGESDPPVHHQIEEEKAIEKERERISLGRSYVPPPSPRQFSLEGQQNASPKSKFLNFFAKLVAPSGKK